MKRLGAFAAIVTCLVMPALAIVPDQDDKTVVTMAPDGSWGSGIEPSVGHGAGQGHRQVQGDAYHLNETLFSWFRKVSRDNSSVHAVRG